MRCMGTTSEYYKTRDIEVSDAVEREIEESYRERHEDVTSYLTTEEFYSSAFDL